MKADQIAVITACIAIIEWIALSEIARVKRLYRQQPFIWIDQYFETYWVCSCFGFIFLTLAYLIQSPQAYAGFGIASIEFLTVGTYGKWIDIQLDS